jgi:hypothetical protein
MSVTISNDYAGLATSAVNNTVLSPGGGGKNAAAGQNHAPGGNQGYDPVQLSQAGRLAATGLLDSLILPTADNVRRLSATLSQDLAALLANAGISPQPPLEFDMSPTGDIQIRGDRPDKEKILEVINADENVSKQIRTTVAISSHAAAMAESLKFQREYLASSDPESVVAKYSYLFDALPKSHNTSLVFDGNGISVLDNGKEWLTIGV